jgi:hypothetical protein
MVQTRLTVPAGTNPEVPVCPLFRRSWSKSGHTADIAKATIMTPSRRARGLGSALSSSVFLLPTERFCDFASAIDDDLGCGAEGPILQSDNSIRPELNW